MIGVVGGGVGSGVVGGVGVVFVVGGGGVVIVVVGGVVGVGRSVTYNHLIMPLLCSYLNTPVLANCRPLLRVIRHRLYCLKIVSYYILLVFPRCFIT